MRGFPLILDAREKIIFKTAAEKGAEKLYERYLEIIEVSGVNICDKSIVYLKAFVNYNPNLCINIIRKKNTYLLSITPYGDEYLDLLTFIAAYHLDRNEKEIGVIWALKTLDLFDYFAPTLDRDLREVALYNLLAQSMVCAYPTVLYKVCDNSFMLDWEIDRFYYCGHKTHFNDNEKSHSNSAS